MWDNNSDIIFIRYVGSHQISVLAGLTFNSLNGWIYFLFFHLVGNYGCGNILITIVPLIAQHVLLQFHYARTFFYFLSKAYLKKVEGTISQPVTAFTKFFFRSQIFENYYQFLLFLMLIYHLYIAISLFSYLNLSICEV